MTTPRSGARLYNSLTCHWSSDAAPAGPDPAQLTKMRPHPDQQTAQDPGAAFERLDELFGKSQTADDVLKLGAFAVHLGCAALGRFIETEAFQRKLLAHPASLNHLPTRNGPN